ncbi:hypothetical protein C5167_007571 [Papaver somniferum]|uniref:uncharacterized protein LOC113341616 isoform X1 n=1 Tax=Papaver somniferum TaxID=3469 RepID=UPI000E6FB373|nr:uncharacterized protein LOC113341616 isoform X1 [Papaver somniferum]RZC92651.1 hypothetical protein C5167_007571 [Papaver somniferum]
MASRCRSISKPALNFFKSTINKPSTTTRPIPSVHLPRSYPTFSRLPTEMGCVQSLLPLFSAVSSSRLTSCLGIDSINSRALSQGTCRSIPGV